MKRKRSLRVMPSTASGSTHTSTQGTIYADYADYADLFAKTTPAAQVYANLPLAMLNAATRGNIIEEIVRRHDEKSNPNTSDAVRGTDVRGEKRGKNRTANDYDRDGVRVEVKSSMLCWNSCNKYWGVQFEKVKREKHDELRLAVFAPDGIHIYVHGGAGYSTNGKRTEAEGGSIAKYGPRNQKDWRAALDVIRSKLGKYVTTIAHDDPDYADLFAKTTPAAQVYAHLPLAMLNAATRGNIIEEIVRRHDEKSNPNTSDAVRGTDVRGEKRGKNRTANDYDRDGVRVEVKSSMLCWNSCNKYWGVQFEKVKREKHDELRLAVFAPDGIHIYVHGGAGYSTNGKRTETEGGNIAKCGPRNQQDWRVALDVIRLKLGKYVGTIPISDRFVTAP